MEGKRVCVIGAGPSGLAQLRAFYSAGQKGAALPDIVCYEKQGDLGGLWNYNWRTGVDEHGEPVHGSMYRYLWSNGPKEVLEFADYSFVEHFGKPIASYPPRAVLFDYIKGRIDKTDIRKWIKFNTVVRNVQYDEQSGKFTVTTRNFKSQAEESEEFDYVVCASGHFSTPNMPYYPGFESFNGTLLHAHNFRDALATKGQDILIIGTSYSAEDIASQCYKYGVKSVTLSWRTAPMEFKWPENFTTVPILEKVVGSTCHFKDGTTKHIDTIIMCTGYQHYFPFLPDSLRLQTLNRLWPNNLYKGVQWMDNPKFFYLGMQDQWFTFNMFDAQAWYARDLMMGRITPPSKEEQLKEMKAWDAREATLEGYQGMIGFQADYVKELISATDYPSFDIDAVIKTFYEWEHAKHNNIMTFRDEQHRSVMTGHMSAPYPITWLEELDDSLENYLKKSHVRE